MVRFISSLAVMVVATFVLAEDKKTDPKLTGTWVKENDQLKMVIEFGKPGELNFVITQDTNVLTLKCEYTMDKDILKAKVKSTDLKGEFGFKPDDKFTYQFKFAINGDKAKLSDFDSSENAEAGKNAVEGEYKKTTK
jgi:hypothetical protein